MRYRMWGPTGLRVSEFFLGTLTFGQDDHRGAPVEECRSMVDRYADAGGNVIDTAVNYQAGAAEEILGPLLQGRRDRFVLASKYAVSRDPGDPNAAGSHRKNLRISLETSLRRLRTDYLDIYWVHIWDRHTPLEETMRALDDAVQAGKILYVGISNSPAWVAARANTLAEWRGWTPFAGIQVPYSLLDRSIESELLPMAEMMGLGVAAWGALGGGVLSGAYTRPEPVSDGAGGGRAGDGGRRSAASSLGERQLAVARAVDAVADEFGLTSSQVAIAWTVHRSGAVHPILGARTASQLTDNLTALEVRLPDAAFERLEAVARFRRGFPADIIEENVDDRVFGTVDRRVDGRETVAARQWRSRHCPGTAKTAP